MVEYRSEAPAAQVRSLDWKLLFLFNRFINEINVERQQKQEAS